jgi:adenine-specific DNA-methyltransferase
MAKLEELLAALPDASVREAIEEEVARLKRRTRFGLVYERHLPETVLLGDVPIRVGDLVRARKPAESEQDLRVVALQGTTVSVVPTNGRNGARSEHAADELVVVKRFGEPIYPALTPIDGVRRSDERPWHAVINGENFHVLQTMLYLWEGQADCIYIDPPYNTGATDWKYNNQYVDRTDQWRHSKWLSFMEKRLRLAKRLLKPDGVLICTIDENEVAHLGVLLEDIFRGYLRHLVTIVHNPKGTAGPNFSAVNEFAYFVVPDRGELIEQLPPAEDQPESGPAENLFAEELIDAEVQAEADAMDESEPELDPDAPFGYSVLYLRRRGAESSARTDRWRQFYAIQVDERTRQVVGIGPLIGKTDSYPHPKREGDVLWVYPIDDEGNERVWRYGRDTMIDLIERGQIRVGQYHAKRDDYTLNHWKPRLTPREQRIRTVWWRPSLDAGTHGTTLLQRYLGRRGAFPFPKSVYAVRDCLEAVVRDKRDALIIDFFAGSGTTLHATALLNAADGGRRRSVLVTNNEVDPKTARQLNKAGHLPGDWEFEKHGIFWSATKPRCEAVITGKRQDGTPIPAGRPYQHVDGRPFDQGFEENCAFFSLSYLDPDTVELGRAFEAIHPMLWLIAGGRGERPANVDATADWLIADCCGYAVLFNEDALRNFEEALSGHDDIRTVFLVTDSEEAYAEMRSVVASDRKTSMLYRDYLRNFRINTPRNLG